MNFPILLDIAAPIDIIMIPDNETNAAVWFVVIGVVIILAAIIAIVVAKKRKKK